MSAKYIAVPAQLFWQTLDNAVNMADLVNDNLNLAEDDEYALSLLAENAEVRRGLADLINGGRTAFSLTEDEAHLVGHALLTTAHGVNLFPDDMKETARRLYADFLAS